MQAGGTGEEPPKAPACSFTTISRRDDGAVALRAELHLDHCAPEVGPEARNTSSRLITMRTGRPALRDSAIATGSR